MMNGRRKTPIHFLPTCFDPLHSKEASVQSIRLFGVRQNNLKGFDLDLPVGKFIAVTGLSGSGKSSLVFETLHAEGQRRYVETFSPYIRQFLDMLDRPTVGAIENIRPSIAIQQSNTVKTSRSTVGTMTELCDFFKVWFCHVAELFDPDTGQKVEDDDPQSIWKKLLAAFPGKHALLTFKINRPQQLSWQEIFRSLLGQGYARILADSEILRLEDGDPGNLETPNIYVIQDRIAIEARCQTRFLEGAETALHFGKGEIHLFNSEGHRLAHYSEGLHSPATGRRFRPSQPAQFSFNSPVGACPRCRGFGRIIEIDYDLVIPDRRRTLKEGVVRAFQGHVYSESQRDLITAAKRARIPLRTPFQDLNPDQQAFVIEGDPLYEKGGRRLPGAWYGVRRFFQWLEGNTYKMHVRVFLSKFRAYTRCPGCDGNRLQREALNWKWQGHTLPELYRHPVSDLLRLIKNSGESTSNHQVNMALESMVSRLSYLDQVGLDYLTLDRTSRTLSGGEVERVNLTSCLGTSLVDTIFVLDEPSIGLHSRDINRLIGILRRLTDQGNTVVVVEHDESIIGAADHVIELGPKPGALGGSLTFCGTFESLVTHENSLTGDYLSGRRTIALPSGRRPVSEKPAGDIGPGRESKSTAWIRFSRVSKHNIQDLDFAFPLQRLVCLSGVSGSGKSTLLDNVIYQGLHNQRGRAVRDPARIDSIAADLDFSEIVLVDQSPISRTPRSNPALFVEAWDPIRELYARSEPAKTAGLTASAFSFNSGLGRCENCQGLGYERIEMQFMADIFVRCPICDGKRFRNEVLAVKWNDKSVAGLLELTVDDAIGFFGAIPKIRHRLASLQEVGLGYLSLGQPLNTMSGGESQRLKLVRYLARFGSSEKHALILLDEPTTGLHRHDVGRLITVLQRLVEHGHSLVVIEHHLDILKCADWVLEMGPEAGAHGGSIIYSGTPEGLAADAAPTTPYLKAMLRRSRSDRSPIHFSNSSSDRDLTTHPEAFPTVAAEERGRFFSSTNNSLQLVGAREHNLKNFSLSLPHREIAVVTGVSGSGKSSLAFDIIFAEGQRRYMESMSPYARQFVEQLPRPDIDQLSGIPPTVAIEQRVTHGTRKSTVATITEVAQYLRLLFARVGIQHSPRTGEPVVSLNRSALRNGLRATLQTLGRRGIRHLLLCASLMRGRKGHHQPLADWASEHDYELLRVDGEFTPIAGFQRLDRYREHDIELALAKLRLTDCGDGRKRQDNGGRIARQAAYNIETESLKRHTAASLDDILDEALRLGKGSCFLASISGRVLAWFSTQRTDPATGEAFPDLDPKHFSWNSKRGWCGKCRGFGRLLHWMKDDDKFDEIDGDDELDHGAPCPACNGERLNPVSRSVKLHLSSGQALSLPRLLALTPSELLDALQNLDLDERGDAILLEVMPEIRERLRFMQSVGLGYLSLDRATATLSGGEAQRIRLAAQLGSNLSGVLYVLDEPSIGLHARDNERLLKSLRALRDKGNTLLIVEHDEDTMRLADRIVDLGPGAGVHGGEVLANGSLEDILKNQRSLTGRYLKSGIVHPLRGSRRPLPPAFSRRRAPRPKDWLEIKRATLRNLKQLDLNLPLRRLIMVCGISGAGKSTLVRDLLKPACAFSSKLGIDFLPGRQARAAGIVQSKGDRRHPFRHVRNGHLFRHVLEVDQRPIGKTARSTPATYIGAFDIIRGFFATLPEARILGHQPGTYSFNTKDGRCEKCKGAGRIKLKMSFMPDTYMNCDGCQGRRFGGELEAIRWRDKNIADILEMTFEEAAAFFDFHAKLKAMLDLMVATGLGYLTLGQSSPSLSGGEAQRLKLVSELAKGLPSYRDKSRGLANHNLYILEEPTIGLHLSDCERLIELLHRLVDQGHTVIVIEHHVDLIAEADYVVEIGPEGGEAGGELLYQGDIEGLLEVRNSPTVPFLRKVLSKSR